LKLHDYRQTIAYMKRRGFANGTPPPKPVEPKRTFNEKIETFSEAAPFVMPRSGVAILKGYLDDALKDGEITQEEHTQALMPLFGETGEMITEQIEKSDRDNFAIGGGVIEGEDLRSRPGGGFAGKSKEEIDEIMSKRFNAAKAKKDANFKKLIDETFKTGNFDLFKAEVTESQKKFAEKQGKVRRGTGIIPAQYINQFNKAIEAGIDSPEFKEILKITGRSEEDILKLNELRPGGKVSVKTRAAAAAESFPEERKKTDVEKLTTQKKARQLRAEKQLPGKKYASEAELERFKIVDKQKRKLNNFFASNPNAINDTEFGKQIKKLMDVRIDQDGNFFQKTRPDSYYVEKAKTKKIFDIFDINKIEKGQRMTKFTSNLNIMPSQFNQAFIEGQVDRYFKPGGRLEGQLNKLNSIDQYLKNIGVKVDIEGIGRIGGGDKVFYETATGKFPHIYTSLKNMKLPDTLLTDINPDMNIEGVVKGADQLPTPEKTQTKNMFKDATKRFAKIPGLNAKIPLITDLFEMARDIPGDLKRAKYLSAGLKTLGIAATPLVAYDSAKAFGEGKPVMEALEQGFIGTNVIGGIKDYANLSDEAKEAKNIFSQQERTRELSDQVLGGPLGFYGEPDQDVARKRMLQTNLPSETFDAETLNIKSEMSEQEAKKIYDQDRKRVAAERAANESTIANTRKIAITNLMDLIKGKRFQGEPIPQEFMATGGRVGFADGPDDPSKRKFIKIGAGLMSLPFVGKYFKAAAPVAEKTTELIRRGADGIPDFIMDLIAKVKLKAEERGMKYFTGNRSDEFADVYQADNFVVTQQGNKINVKKVDDQGEFGYKEHEMELDIDPETGGMTYNEGTIKPDAEGKLKDIEEFIDEVDLEDMKKYTYDE